jgi:hypothetical protein
MIVTNTLVQYDADISEKGALIRDSLIRHELSYSSHWFTTDAHRFNIIKHFKAAINSFH